jgi:hypothetical protein
MWYFITAFMFATALASDEDLSLLQTRAELSANLEASNGGFVFATGFNQNCQQVCQAAGGSAAGCDKPYKDQSWYHWDDSFQPAKSQAEKEALAIFKANGFECPSYHWSGSGFVYESSQRKCYIPVPGGNVLCGHRQTNFRQMCYCEGVTGYPNIEETTTTTTTANPAWDNFVFGNVNQNCNQVCAAAGGECNGEGPYSEQTWYHNFGWTEKYEPAKSQTVKEALAIFKSKGFECPSYVWSGSGFLYETTQRKCYIPVSGAGYSCGHAQTNYRQMCYCGPEQTTTTTTTTADPDWANFVLATGFNQDCNQVCAEAGGECSGEGQYQDQSWYKWDDTKEPDKSIGAKEARAIFKSKGFDCPNSYDKWSGSGFVYESRANECYWPVHNAGYRCDMRQSNYRNMCRCSGGVFDPTTTAAAATTTTTTQLRCSLGPRNTNGDCPAGSNAIASAADCEACKDALGGNDVDDYNIGYKPEDIWWASSGNWGGDVKGCYLNTQANSLYFNVATGGAPSPYMRPVCGGGAIPPSEQTPAPTPAKVCRSSCHKGEYIKKKSCQRDQCKGCCECTGECTPKSKPRREKKCKDKCYRKRGDQSMKKHMCHKNKCGACPECINPSFLEADENDGADDDDVDDDDVDDDDEDLA